ncbi:hypothetical protein [Thalassotalea maritima]|uniref:hypothetical protein n=1 Tax=Thalassotalea maritima TaxID=3242416 RepID=UPI00352806F8
MENEVCFCKACNQDTDHARVIVKPQLKEAKSRKEKVKEFLSALIAGWGAGATAGFMELRELHVICTNCGHKNIENYRGDLS